MAIDSKDLLVWVKAMSRGQALPLDASEIYESMTEAEAYTTSAIAYAGQTIKVLQEDGKYHEYILQPSDSGYVLENAGVDVHDHNDIYYTETEIDSMIGAFVEEDYVIEQIETAIANQNLFSGDYNDLTNKPTIPTIPDTLPANGGNADTVDGKHAEDFALADHDHDDMYVSMQTFTDLVGDTKVEDQINDKLNDIQIEKEIYAQNDEPVDAADGTVWIDMDAFGSIPSGSTSFIDNTLTKSDYAADAKVVGDRLRNLEKKINLGISATDDGNGNVVIETAPTTTITDDGNGNVIIS